jgi:predicted nucleic acid-binding protein
MPVNVSDARVSVDLFDRYAPQGIPARDLVHAAVMQNNGIDTIISTDALFDEIEGIVRLDPQAI